MNTKYLPNNTSKRFIHPDDRAARLSKQELMDAYDRLKGKKKARTQLEENGFIVACPHCQNHDLSKIYLVELVQEDREITKVEGGVIHYGEWLDSQYTGVHSGRCGKCGLSFELPTKASTKKVSIFTVSYK